MGRDRSGSQRVGRHHLPKQCHHMRSCPCFALRLPRGSSLQSPRATHDGRMGCSGPVRWSHPCHSASGVPWLQQFCPPTPLDGAVCHQPGTGCRRCVQPQPPPVLRALRLPLARGHHWLVSKPAAALCGRVPCTWSALGVVDKGRPVNLHCPFGAHTLR